MKYPLLCFLTAGGWHVETPWYQQVLYFAFFSLQLGYNDSFLSQAKPRHLDQDPIGGKLNWAPPDSKINGCCLSLKSPGGSK